MCYTNWNDFLKCYTETQLTALMWLVYGKPKLTFNKKPFVSPGHKYKWVPHIGFWFYRICALDKNFFLFYKILQCSVLWHPNISKIALSKKKKKNQFAVMDTFFSCVMLGLCFSSLSKWNAAQFCLNIKSEIWLKVTLNVRNILNPLQEFNTWC